MPRLNSILTFLLICIVTGKSSAVIWPCETNDDCTAVGSVCSTSTGLCECTDFESVFSNDYTKCLKTSLVGDQCEETVQCNLMPSGAHCKTGVCDCVDGHTYVRGRCRPLNGLDQPCDTDLDCYFGYDRLSVSCQNQICACANGYYRRNGNICRRKSMEIDDACVVDTDCDELGANVKCISLKCQRDNNDNDKTKKVEPAAAAEAAIDTNGNSSAASKLKSETSVTSETVSQFSKSSKSFEEESANDSPPSSPRQTKVENQVQVHQHQSQLADETETVEAAAAPAVASVSNVAAPDAAIFVNGRDDLLEFDTEAVQTTNLGRNQRLREIAVQTSLETIELKPLSSSVASQVRNVGTATASTSTSSRRASYYRRRRRIPLPYYRTDEEDKTFSTLSNTDDDVDENKFGSSCTENGKPCTGVAHSICSNSMCLCRQGYYLKGGKCFAELGEIAESADECEHAFEERTKKCLCQKNYFYERSLRACRKPIQYHLSCTSNSQCSPFGASFCLPDIPRRCTCEEYAEYDAMRQMCIYKQGLGAQCESNDGCPVEHSICSNRYCVCKQNFVQKDDVCVAGVGAECKFDDDCLVDNRICADTTALTKIETESDNDEEDNKEKQCQCRKGFVHFKDECLKEAVEIDDECIDTEQCKPLLGSCIDKKCSCTPEQHLKNGRCEDKKGLGEPCAKAGECFIEKDPENVECRNSICQCKFGYQSDVEQRSCIRVTPNKKNSSGRPSALKIITFLLIGSAFLITSAAIKQAYY